MNNNCGERRILVDLFLLLPGLFFLTFSYRNFYVCQSGTTTTTTAVIYNLMWSLRISVPARSSVQASGDVGDRHQILWWGVHSSDHHNHPTREMWVSRASFFSTRAYEQISQEHNLTKSQILFFYKAADIVLGHNGEINKHAFSVVGCLIRVRISVKC